MKKKKGKRKVLRVLIILLILVLIAGGFYYYRFMRPQAARDISKYAQYTAQKGTISNSLSFSGNLQLIDNETFYPSGSTKVRKIMAEEGKKVKKGTKLMRLANGQTIEAGFDGTINKIYVSENEEVAETDALIQVADFNHMKVSVRVDEYDIGKTYVGQPCVITTTASEDQLESAISSIDFISAATSGTVAYYNAEAFVNIEDGAAIYPGMQVTMTIPLQSVKDVIILKESALSFDNMNQAYVLMMNEEHQLQPTAVEVGMSNGNYVEIKSGLNEGDTVYVKSEQSSAGLNMMMMGGMRGQRSNRQGRQNGERSGGSNGNGAPGGNGGNRP